MIARRLGRAASTVSREVNANGGRRGYRGGGRIAEPATWLDDPRSPSSPAVPGLRAQVETWLEEELWSPAQISAQLRIEFPDDPMMRVSPETIYQSLYVQGRGALRKELAACLRTGRAIRRNRSRLERGGRIPDMVIISERPAEVDDRAVPGHWEGDLIIGKNNASAVGTLVERSTRYVMLLHLPGDHTAETVRTAMTAKIKTLPEHLMRSITWDQGTEMAQHAAFTIDTGIAHLLLRPALAVAARLEREHQRPAPPMDAQRHRPRPSTPKPTSTPSPTNSTTALDKPSAG